MSDTYTTKAGLLAQRNRPREVTRAGGYRCVKFDCGWKVNEADGTLRSATSSEARYLNSKYGAGLSYGGPNHPSWRPW